MPKLINALKQAQNVISFPPVCPKELGLEGGNSESGAEEAALYRVAPLIHLRQYCQFQLVAILPTQSTVFPLLLPGIGPAMLSVGLSGAQKTWLKLMHPSFLDRNAVIHPCVQFTLSDHSSVFFKKKILTGAAEQVEE